MNRFCYFALLLVLSGCLTSRRSDVQLVQVPMYKFDLTAQFQSILTQQLVSSGRFMVEEGGSGWVLSIKMKSNSTDYIGWQYDQEGFDPHLEKNTVPNEARRAIALEVTVLDAITSKPIYDPFTVSAEGEYDFIDTDSIRDFLLILPSGMPDNVRQFSLGQLDSEGAAQQNIEKHIYTQLAIETVEHLLLLKETAGLPWRQ